MTARSPARETRSISSAIACSHGQRSASVERMAGAHLGDVACRVKPVAILVSASRAVAARRSAMVLLPEPETPITTSAQGVLLPTKILRQRRAIDQPDRLAGGSRAIRRAGSRRRTAASRSRACPRPPPRTAFRGRRRAWAASASPAARTARHSRWARRPPSAWFRPAPRSPGNSDAVWPSGPTPISTRSNSGRAGSSAPRRRTISVPAA